MIEGDGDPPPLEEQTAILRAALPVGAELAAAVAIAEDAQKGLADALAAARAALPADAPAAPSDGEAPCLRNFCVRWVSPGAPIVTLTSPWWPDGVETTETSLGLRQGTAPVFVAAVRAVDKAHAERVVFRGVTGADVVVEFVKEMPSDWSPFSERFPRADWMDWPEIPRPRVGDTVQVAGLPGHALTVDMQAREETSTPDGLQGLVAALTIFAKYNPKARTHCEDQVLWIMGVTLQEIAPEDRRALYELSFSWDALEECWCSSWFGAS